jgi:hypothetical protein
MFGCKGPKCEIDNLMKTIQNLNMYIYHDIPFTVGLTLKYNMCTMGYWSKRKVREKLHCFHVYDIVKSLEMHQKFRDVTVDIRASRCDSVDLCD